MSTWSENLFWVTKVLHFLYVIKKTPSNGPLVDCSDDISCHARSEMNASARPPRVFISLEGPQLPGRVVRVGAQMHRGGSRHTASAASPPLGAHRWLVQAFIAGYISAPGATVGRLWCAAHAVTSCNNFQHSAARPRTRRAVRRTRAAKPNRENITRGVACSSPQAQLCRRIAFACELVALIDGYLLMLGANLLACLPGPAQHRPVHPPRPDSKFVPPQRPPPPALISFLGTLNTGLH